jgi:hypothetical protein
VSAPLVPDVARHHLRRRLVAIALLLPGVAACGEDTSEPDNPHDLARKQGQELLKDWGCQQVEYQLGSKCRDSDVDTNFGAKLEMYGTWAAIQNPYATPNQSDFLAETCRRVSFGEINSSWTHVIVEPGGAWKFITSNDRLARGAVEAGGVDLRDPTGPSQVC